MLRSPMDGVASYVEFSLQRCSEVDEGDEACSTLRIWQAAEDGIGFQVWSAALALARYLEASRSLASLRVLELGCGPGLLGIACAHLGASVTLTDKECVLPLTRKNVDCNPVPPGRTIGAVQVRELAWGSDVQEPWCGCFDLVLGSDLTYFEHLLEPLLVSVLQVATEGTEVLLAHAHRHASESKKEKLHICVCTVFGSSSEVRWQDLFGDHFDIRLVERREPGFEMARRMRIGGHVDSEPYGAAQESVPVSISWGLPPSRGEQIMA
ncbi:unnamed protein product [Prorocentrum cordatum]|uniref:Calmodulin-lysine N-methyltransferase n=1 Tax=Prorocentrum cordatum TaxID=2364126 RepID=A0ABN9S4H9_9DINO|nr:unnamed protein product [Polarella glacialis]